MARFWYFIIYSFGGYLLEKGFAAVTRARHRVRKCFLLLPLCPVYGLAMTAVLLLPQELTGSFLSQALYGGIAATAVEYAVHFLYERLLGVMFWDYSATKMDLNRRICMPFSIAWGLLSALAVRFVQPWLAVFVTRIPPWLSYAMVLLVVLDSFFSVRVLLERHDIDLLGWPNLLRSLQEG